MPGIKLFQKYFSLFVTGGLVYFMIEIFYRGRSHWSMFILGGLCFLLIGEINEHFSWDMPLWKQGIIGAFIVTYLELLFGIVFNIWLGLRVWDYSNLPFNLWGQICLPFSAIWFVISIIAVVADDWLRYWIWNEERPRYKTF